MFLSSPAKVVETPEVVTLSLSLRGKVLQGLPTKWFSCEESYLWIFILHISDIDVPHCPSPILGRSHNPLLITGKVECKNLQESPISNDDNLRYRAIGFWHCPRYWKPVNAIHLAFNFATFDALHGVLFIIGIQLLPHSFYLPAQAVRQRCEIGNRPDSKV